MEIHVSSTSAAMQKEFCLERVKDPYAHNMTKQDATRTV